MTAPTAPRAETSPPLCVSYVGARRLRVTRLDSCGRPVYGPKSTVVSSGFVSVEIEPESEEGDDYTTKNAAGELCINEKGPDQIKWYTVAIEFCRVDPELFQMMNPTWDPVKNYSGVTTGWAMGQDMSDATGFALEVWPKTTNSGTACLDDTSQLAEDYERNGYLLMPWVVATAPDSWTFENDAATFSLNGRTKPGSLWGRGPYNVTHDQNGNPAPLVKPIDPGFNVPQWDPPFTSSGDPKHVWIDVVTVKPPVSQSPNGCGAFGLWNDKATAPTIKTTATSGNTMSADFEVTNWTSMKPKSGVIEWGDGKQDRIGPDSQGKSTHVYADAEDGVEQTLTFTPGNGHKPVTVTFTPKKSGSGSGETSGDDTHTIVLTLTHPPTGEFAIDWGDGYIDTATGGGPHRHTYEHAGTYDVVTTDEIGSEVTRDQFTVPKEQ